MDNAYKGTYISTATTTTVGTQPSGILHSVVIGETAAGSITIADSVGTKAVLKSNIAEGTYLFDIGYSGYLTVTTAAASKITINWK